MRNPKTDPGLEEGIFKFDEEVDPASAGPGASSTTARPASAPPQGHSQNVSKVT